MNVPVGPRPPDAVDRLDYLQDTAARLWPGRTVQVGPAAAAGPDSEDYLLLPRATRPRLMVPAGSRRVAARGLRAHAEQSRGRERFTAGLAAAGIRIGLSRALAPDRVRISGTGPALAEHLSQVLDRAVTLALPLSPPRANRKPVLRLLGPGGATVGFAKLGVDRLTSRLVRAETAALRRLAGVDLPGVAVPAVLAETLWGGAPLLVQAPLPTRGQRGGQSLGAAMAAVADVDRSPVQALGGSAYWTSLTARVARLPASATATHLGQLTGRLAEAAGGLELSFGSWHGDWTPWNCARRRGVVTVWDWERFGGPVPLGFDALHHRLQTDLVVARQDPAAAVERCVDLAAVVLDPFDIPVTGHLMTSLGYLIDLATRYTEDRQDAAGARFGQVSQWLLPTVDARVRGLRR